MNIITNRKQLRNLLVIHFPLAEHFTKLCDYYMRDFNECMVCMRSIKSLSNDNVDDDDGGVLCMFFFSSFKLEYNVLRFLNGYEFVADQTKFTEPTSVHRNNENRSNGADLNRNPFEA